MVVDLTPAGDGKYQSKFTQVGDTDALVIRLGDPIKPIRHHTSRPNSLSAATGGYKLLDDGRLQRGQTLNLRMDPTANMVDLSLGHAVKDDGKIPESTPDEPLETGDIVLVATDGFFENFGSLEMIHDIIKSSGARTPAEIRDVLMLEAMIRQNLLSVAKGQAINPDHYAQAYRQATGGQEPPSGWKGMYEPRPDSAGQWHGYSLGRGGVVMENIFANGKKVSSEAVDHFKKDNITLMVQVLE
jgi:hypothetical protein